MTLDYNYESTFYGAFSGNHAAQSATYASVLLDWLAPARVLAQRYAGAQNVSCAAEAALFGCHLAPHGFSSWDQSV